MPATTGTTIIVCLLSIAIGAFGIIALMRRFDWLSRWSGLRSVSHPRITATAHGVTERIRSVGKIIGLEVVSKEIVTQTRGLSWLPPLLLSQARLAMIFHFEKQYFIDLSTLEPSAIRQTGTNRFTIDLPDIEESLRLIDVVPYDIQAGRLLGLIDVFRMDAATQRELMAQAHEEAKHMHDSEDAQFMQQARDAICNQLLSLFDLVDVQVELRFPAAIGQPSPVTHQDPSLHRPSWTVVTPSLSDVFDPTDAVAITLPALAG